MPQKPKIYHIVHVNRLSSIIDKGYLFCDNHVVGQKLPGTSIGMPKLKQKRLKKSLGSYKELLVGDCVPFYFCPRSVMLYVINRAKYHEDMEYEDGQNNILHLQADLFKVVAWARQKNLRWVFTTGNAAAADTDDYRDLNDLNKIKWQAVEARAWKNNRAAKQSEFLLEKKMPFHLIENIGVINKSIQIKVQRVLKKYKLLTVSIEKEWYY